MGELQARGADGRNYRFLISGDQPSAEEQAQIQSTLAGKPAQTAEAPKEDQSGILSNLGKGLVSGGAQFGAGLAGMVEGMGKIHTPEMDALGIDSDAWKEYRHQLNKYAQENGPQDGAWEDQHGAYETTRYLAGQLGNSGLSSAGAMLAQSKVAGLPGFLIGSALSYPQQFNENLNEQEAQNNGEVKDWGKAVGATAVSAALEGVADKATLGAAGLGGKVVPKAAKDIISNATKNAYGRVIARVGEGAGMGLITEGGTEALQQALTRWQAEKPLTGDEAMGEYLENAIVGGLLGSAMGGGAGVIGGVHEARDNAAIGQAMQDVDAERQTTAAAKLNADKLMEARTKSAETEVNQEITTPTAAPILPSPTRVSSYADEQAQMRRSERGTDTALPEASDLFTDDEYLQAIDKMRGEKLVSQEKLKNALGLGRKKADGEKAAAIMKAMQDRKDAKPAGSAGQYLSIVDKKQGNVSADTEGRSYEVAPVKEAPSYQVRIGNRKVGELFNSAEEAQEFASSTGLDKKSGFTIETNPTTSKYGVYERGSVGGTPVNRLVNSFDSQADADAHALGLDPRYSPKTNQVKNSLQIQEKVDRETKTALGGFQTNVQTLIDKITGNRATVDVQPTIKTPEGVAPGTVIEGLATKDPTGHVIQLAGDLFDNSNPQAQQEALNALSGHEAFHVLRSADVIKGDELGALGKDIMSKKVPGKRYTWLQLAAARNEGSNLSPNQLMEEAAAEMVRAHIKDPTLLDKDSRSFVQKIVDFLRALGKFSKTTRGQQVMKDILSGEIGKRADGAGGQGARSDLYGPYYSTVKIPGFYFKSSQWIEGQKPDQVYPGQQWAAMMQPNKSGIKKAELDWLGLEDWLKGQGKVSAKQIAEYIGANSLAADLNETQFGTSLTQEEEDEYYNLAAQAEEYNPLIRQSFLEDVGGRHSVNYDHYAMQPDKYGAWINDQVDQGGSYADEARKWKAVRDRLKELDTKSNQAYTNHEGTTQEGGHDYQELLIHMPKLEAFRGKKFSMDAHYGGFENIIAGARFKTRFLGNKKHLFIEEIQSDIHQKGAKNGYYSKTDEAQLEMLMRRLQQLGEEKQAAIRPLMEAEEARRQEHNNNGGQTTTPEYEALNQQVEDLNADFQRAAKLEREYGTQVTDFKKRMQIPDAPFKKNWEELAIKRIVRYAAENGFDEISWNGEPEGVRQTEHYDNLEHDVDAEGKDQYNVVYDRGDRDQPPIKQNVTGIVNFYTKKMRNVVSNLFSKPEFGSPVPYLYDPGEAARNAKSEVPSDVRWKEQAQSYLQEEHDFIMGVGAVAQDSRGTDPDYSKKLRTAIQIVRQQRIYDPYAAFQQAFGEEPGFRIFEELHDMYVGGTYNPDEQYRSDVDANGNPMVKRWALPITPELREKATQDEAFTYFSAVGPKDLGPNFDEVQYAATAPMGQRVPARPPTNKLEEIQQKARYNVISPKVKKLVDITRTAPIIEWFGKDESAETKIENTFIALQDRMLSLGKYIDRVKDNGGFISNANDTYLQQQLLSGRIDFNLRSADKRFYEPLADVVHGLGMTTADVEGLKQIHGGSGNVVDILNQYMVKTHKQNPSPNQAMAEVYLYAQHALERNAMMQKRNENLVLKGYPRTEQHDAGSGMGDGEAIATLDYINSRWASKFSDLANPNSVRSRYRALIKHTNDTRVDGGLNPDFRNMLKQDGTPVDVYQDYAPLRGWLDSNPDRQQDDIDNAIARTGKGLTVKGKEDFAATGRASLASNLLATAILQNQEAIVRAGKNKVAQSFLNLISQTGSMQVEPGKLGVEFAQVIPSTQPKVVYDAKTGVARMSNQAANRDPNVLTVKQGGKETNILIKDPRIREAMLENSTLGEAGQMSFMRYLLTANRYLAAVRTSYNPEFLIPNFMRDAGAALVNLNEFDLQGLKGDVMKQTLPAIKEIYKSVRDESYQSTWSDVYKEFDARGGKTSFMGIHDLESSLKNMNKKLSENTDGKLQKSKDAVASVFNFMEDYNAAVENGVRVSTYKNVRDKLIASMQNPSAQDISDAKDQAAFIAKNLTINFNMGGKMKPQMNAMYLFYNASMQGSAALLNPLIRSKKVRRLWMGAVAGGIMQDLIMSALSPTDDDGEKTYDKIRDQTLETNMIIMDPFGLVERGYFQIPLPYLFNGAWNSGRALTKYIRGGEKSIGKTLNSVAGTLVNSVNPWGTGGAGWLNTVAPTVADPLVDLYVNKNFAGVPIRPPESPYGATEIPSQKYWNNTSPAYVSIANWMDRLTGGDDVLPGGMSFSPNQYEYVFEFLGGGAWSTLVRAAGMMPEGVPGGTDSAAKLFTGQADVNDIPFLRRLMGNITTKSDLGSYAENRDRVKAVRTAMQDALKAGDTDKYRQIMQDYPTEYRLAAQVNAIDGQRKKISAQINKIKDNVRIPDDQKKSMVDNLKRQQEALVKRGLSVMGDM